MDGTEAAPVILSRFTSARPSCDGEFATVYDECAEPVLRYMLARVRSRETAEDLAAETFERALRAWPSFEGRSSSLVWVLGIAHHVAVDHIRRRRPTVSFELVSGSMRAGTSRSPEHILSESEEEKALRAALRRLSNDDQAILGLRYAAELSFRDVARVLGIGEVAARVRVHRALRRLRTVLLEMEP